MSGVAGLESEAEAAILPSAGLSVPHAPAGPARLRVSIDNLDEIGAAFGPAARAAALDHVRSLLRIELCGRHLESAEHALRRLSETPVAHDGQRFHLSVSLSPTGSTDGSARIASFGRGSQAIPNTAWHRRYRADMALAVSLFARMAAGDLCLAWQPVCRAANPAEQLYEEGLLRMVGADGAAATPGETIAALERTGLIRALDLHVMTRAIAWLEAAPDRRIGVNLSALSLAADHWWEATLERLRSAPDIARRLYVEITETAPVPDQEAAAAFASALRGAGCRIVLDDFGAGHSSLRLLRMLAPEVVKLDRRLLREASETQGARAALAHLAGYVKSSGSIVAVEGVETAADSLLARAAGIEWQQGYHFGVPSFTAGRAATPHIIGPGQPNPSGSEGAPTADTLLEQLLLRWDKVASSGAKASVALDGDTGIAISTLAPPLLVERGSSRAGVWL